MHALASRVDERPFDMDAERAGNPLLRLARRRQRLRQHPWRIGHHRRQKPGDAGAPMRGGDRSDSLHGRVAVEQNAAAAVDLPVDEAGAENSAVEIHLLAAARAVVEQGQRPDQIALDHQRAVVAEPLAVEDAGAGEHFHCAASLCAAMTPPAMRIAPSLASCSGGESSAAISGSR